MEAILQSYGVEMRDIYFVTIRRQSASGSEWSSMRSIALQRYLRSAIADTRGQLMGRLAQYAVLTGLTSPHRMVTVAGLKFRCSSVNSVHSFNRPDSFQLLATDNTPNILFESRPELLPESENAASRPESPARPETPPPPPPPPPNSPVSPKQRAILGGRW